jgi:general secretion pathway protein K
MRQAPLQTRQAGAALLAAMLTVTLVATFAAAALWQQWRSVEVETAERARVQATWILTGALDWSRLILSLDCRPVCGADHLAEIWAVPLNEARLSSFLAVDKNASDTEREAFLSGQGIDLQSKLNVNNLIEGNSLSAGSVAAFSRLFELLGLPKEQVLTLASGLLSAVRDPAPPAAPPNPNAAPAATGAAVAAAPAASAPVAPVTPQAPVVAAVATALSPLMPERVDQLAWLGLPRETLTALGPYITLLPQRTTVNLNTASAEVIYASTPGLDMAGAQRLVTARDRKHFSSLAEANQQIGGTEIKFTEVQHAVASKFFEVTGQLRLEQTLVQERSVLQREGLVVRTLWRERGVVISPPPASGGRP